jgi:phytoene synthase
MLQEIIDAYAQELDGGSLATAARLEAHLAATHGVQLHLAARILGAPRPSADPLLHAAAQAWGRVQLLRALPLLANQGRNPFGEESAAVYGPSLLQQARAELVTARQRVTSVPATIRPALLPLALVEPYLKALEGLGPDVAKRRAEISPLTRAWRLLKANALGRV